MTPSHKWALDCFNLLDKAKLDYGSALEGVQQLFGNVLKECYYEYIKQNEKAKFTFEDALDHEINNMRVIAADIKKAADEYYKEIEAKNSNVIFLNRRKPN